MKADCSARTLAARTQSIGFFAKGVAMKTLLVFNGGAEGALLLTSNGAYPAQLSEPEVLNALKATAKLVVALSASSSKSSRTKLSKMSIGAANLSVEMVENLFGPLNPERAIVFLDDDGGFICGSTGKPPIHVPWPPRPFKEPGDLIKAGIIESDVLELIRKSKAEGNDLTKVFENPAAAAKALGLPLSAKSASDLSQLAPSKVSKVKDPVDREMMKLFLAVLKDGRYTQTWFERPYEVSRALNVKISDTAIDRIASIAATANFGNIADEGTSAICAGVIWAGVCIAVGTLFVGQMNPIDTLIKDRSGTAKF
jgi:hypothetical protein